MQPSDTATMFTELLLARSLLFCPIYLVPNSFIVLRTSLNPFVILICMALAGAQLVFRYIYVASNRYSFIH